MTVVGEGLGMLSIVEVASEGINGVEAGFGIPVVRLLLVNLRDKYPRGLGKEHLSRNGGSDSNWLVAVFIALEGIEIATNDELRSTIVGEMLGWALVTTACGK